MKNLFIAFLGVFMFVSCSSEDNVSDINSDNHTMVSKSFDEYKNIDYVEIGVQHNLYMEKGFYEADKIGKVGKDVQMKLDFGLNKEIQSQHYDVLDELSISEKYELVLNNMKDENAKKDLLLIRDIIYTSENYSDLVEKFNVIEKNIKSNYSGLDYGVLMSSIEIGKHSALLWFNNELGGLNKGESYLKMSKYGTSRLARSKSVDSDVLGGALGMVGWAITGGAVFGPFGALGGMLAATVYGAVTGSLFSVS